MLRLSKKADYGLMAMKHLALRGDRGALAHCRNQDVRPPAHLREVRRPGVRNGHGGVPGFRVGGRRLLQQQQQDLRGQHLMDDLLVC